MEILQKLWCFKKFNYPIFAALSRKSNILWVKNSKSNLALIETCITNFMALLHWAEYIRVHDIKEAKFTIELLQSYNKDFL
jgi:dihydropteroate synthase